jgi:hypothetical protein
VPELGSGLLDCANLFKQFYDCPSVVGQFAGLCRCLFGRCVLPAKVPIADEQSNRMAQVFDFLEIAQSQARKAPVEQPNV